MEQTQPRLRLILVFVLAVSFPLASAPPLRAQPATAPQARPAAPPIAAPTLSRDADGTVVITDATPGAVIIARLDGHDNISFLDIGPKFLNPDGTISKDVMNDYLHPTAKGYRIWAQEMEPTLAKLLGPS